MLKGFVYKSNVGLAIFYGSEACCLNENVMDIL